MNEKSRDNLSEALARMESTRRAADGLKADRSRLAKVLRAARIRVKANKKLYGAYLAGLTDPRD